MKKGVSLLIIVLVRACMTRFSQEVRVEVPVKVPYEVQKKVEVPVTVTNLLEVSPPPSSSLCLVSLFACLPTTCLPPICRALPPRPACLSMYLSILCCQSVRGAGCSPKMPSRFPFALADLFETNHPVSQVPVESKVIETRAVELVKETPKEVVREVTVPILTREEVAKEVHLTKTVVQDRLVVTKDRVEVPQPVTVLKEIPLYTERIVEVPVKEERIQEKVVEMTKQVAVELVRQVSTNVCSPLRKMHLLCRGLLLE